jgi:ABC-type multidrug transport system ATPase subunit
MITALTIRGLAKRFRYGLPGAISIVDVLRGVDLDVHLGEIVGIVGDDGAGKTTLLMCLAGMLRPDAGSIAWFGGTGLLGVPPAGVAYVPERPCYYPFLTVGEAIEYYATARELARRDRDARVHTALDLVGLTGCNRLKISQLSRSMHQRLGLAQALIDRPRLLLVDDALRDLEEAAFDRATAVLRMLATEGTTVVIGAREPASVRPVATRVVALARGALVAVGEQSREAVGPRFAARVAEAFM